MNRDMKYMNRLARLAEDLEPVASARVASFLVHRNEIIGYGFNQNKTSTFQAKWGRNSEAIFNHAETSAVHNALKRFDVEELRDMKTTLYVCRIKKFRIDSKTKDFVNVFGLSAPCEGCRRCLTHHAINRVVFSLDAETPNTNEFGVWYP